MSIIESGAANAHFLPRELFQQGIFFTGQPPTTIQAGVKTKLQWYGGDGKPVKITLNVGAAGADGETVMTIASGLSSPISGVTYTWTPPTSIPNGNDYYYLIYQDLQNSAQSGALIYSGGAPPSASLPASLTATNQGASATTLVTSASSSTGATAVLTTIITHTPSSTPLPSTLSDSSTHTSTAPIAIGASLGALVVLLAGLAFFLFRHRRRHARRSGPMKQANGGITSTDDLLMSKHPELSYESEVFEVRSDRDTVELDTPRSLGFLPAGTGRQELPSPVFAHEVFSQESLCELEGSVVGDEKGREGQGDEDSNRKKDDDIGIGNERGRRLL